MICEISGGIAAAVKKNDVSWSNDIISCGWICHFQLRSAFTESANATFLKYTDDESERASWNSFQESVSKLGDTG